MIGKDVVSLDWLAKSHIEIASEDESSRTIRSQENEFTRGIVEENSRGVEFLQRGKLKEGFEVLKQCERRIIEELKALEDASLGSMDQERQEKRVEAMRLLSITLNNLACYCKKKALHQVALRYLTKVLQIEKRIVKNEHTLASTHLNISSVLSCLNKHDTALRFAEHANKHMLRLRQAQTDQQTEVPPQEKVALVSSYINMSVAAERAGNRSLAWRHACAGHQLALVDLGASHHMTASLKQYVDYITPLMKNSSHHLNHVLPPSERRNGGSWQRKGGRELELEEGSRIFLTRDSEHHVEVFADRKSLKSKVPRHPSRKQDESILVDVDDSRRSGNNRLSSVLPSMLDNTILEISKEIGHAASSPKGRRVVRNQKFRTASPVQGVGKTVMIPRSAVDNNRNQMNYSKSVSREPITTENRLGIFSSSLNSSESRYRVPSSLDKPVLPNLKVQKLQPINVNIVLPKRGLLSTISSKTTANGDETFPSSQNFAIKFFPRRSIGDDDGQRVTEPEKTCQPKEIQEPPRLPILLPKIVPKKEDKLGLDYQPKFAVFPTQSQPQANESLVSNLKNITLDLKCQDKGISAKTLETSNRVPELSSNVIETNPSTQRSKLDAFMPKHFTRKPDLDPYESGMPSREPSPKYSHQDTQPVISNPKNVNVADIMTVGLGIQ